MKIHSYSILNPLRMVDTSDINNGFDGDFAVRQLLSYQHPRCYFQPWRRNTDVINLQIISDFEPSAVEFKDVYTDLLLASAIWVVKDTVIVDQTFKVYEISFPMSNMPEGRYYAQYSYTNDEQGLLHVLMSEPFESLNTQENTLYIQYKHSVNDFDVIFETGIVFNIRLGCAIKDYQPGNNRDIYNDQPVNPTLLNAQPFRKFKFYIGLPNKPFVPDWVFDKLNYIQSVDQIKYNDVFYTVLKGAEYETEREDSSKQITGNIEVQPTNNNYNRYVVQPDDDTNPFIPMQKQINYLGKGADFNVAGYFDEFSVLEYFAMNKRLPLDDNEFELKLGLTPGGSEIGIFTPNNAKFLQECFWFFNQTTTVYVSGITSASADVDMYFIYKQLNEKPIDPGQINPTPVWVVPIGATWIYIESEDTPGQFDADFDAATGLGRSNTNWFNWAVCDGNNGTRDMRGFVPIGIDQNDLRFNAMGKSFGEKEHKLTIQEMPSHAHGTDMKPNIAGAGTARGAQGPQNSGSTAATGGDQSHNNIQPSKAVYYVTKIA